MATVVAAEPRFSVHQATYSVSPLTSEATRLSDDTDGVMGIEGTSYISVLVMSHGIQGMVWTWAQVSKTPPSRPGSLQNLVLAMPSVRPSQKASASYLLGGGADDPTADISRRLTTRFKRPVFVSLSNVGGSKLVGAMSVGDDMAVSPGDVMAALERCLLAELKSAATTKVVDLDNPTLEQKSTAIADLRAVLPDEINEYCSDSEKSAAMIKTWYRWRKDACIDDMPVCKPDNLYPVPYPIRGYLSVADANLTAGVQVKESQIKLNRFFGGGCWHKRDKDDHPVYIERIGRYKIKDIPRVCTMGELFEFHYIMQEFIGKTVFPECSHLAGREISKQVVIFDLAGISIGMLSHLPALNMLREMLAKDQLYYPECMHRTYVVNAPAMFVTAWKLIKGWLDPRVISKVHILGKDYSKVLLNQIPAENLPSFLGGSCRCSHMAGGCVPSTTMNNYIDLPRKAYINLRHQTQLSYSSPRHSFTFDVIPTTPPTSTTGSPVGTPLLGYASWFGLKKDSPKINNSSSSFEFGNSPRSRYVCLRFLADRGRGMVIEVVWRPHSSTDSAMVREQDEVLIYPEMLLDPQRAPVVLELKVPNRSGLLTFNWRVANFDEGQAPFPTAEEAQIPITLEYSVDLEEDLIQEFGLSPIKRD
ncbi:hypothetical protein GGI15_000581 [Coemansia interrupta]|uniref:CRAL-TRIO domain-containing protein n=1 Tax=Coemansia interrupta TaxID=1126814 RepID=A0A9W8HMX9_9FUNG|nr:hypothetical protein GGI15_000581 [Coemansia interrupta]